MPLISNLQFYNQNRWEKDYSGLLCTQNHKNVLKCTQFSNKRTHLHRLFNIKSSITIIMSWTSSWNNTSMGIKTRIARVVHNLYTLTQNKSSLSQWRAYFYRRAFSVKFRSFHIFIKKRSTNRWWYTNCLFVYVYLFKTHYYMHKPYYQNASHFDVMR